jgi:hypothetical protein
MIPMVMSVDVRGRDRRRVRFFIPLLLVYLVALPFVLLALPFVLVAALVAALRGTGARWLAACRAAVAVLASLSGLRVDVASHGDDRVFVMFR